MAESLKLRATRIEKQAVSQKEETRSPCEDAHYEAFILQSRWTVGNLYASNLNLGQTYMKRVADMERQRKTWLRRKESEQKKMLDKLDKLTEAQEATKSFVLNCDEFKSAKGHGNGNHSNYRDRSSSAATKLSSACRHESWENLYDRPKIRPGVRIRSMSELSKPSAPFPAVKSAGNVGHSSDRRNSSIYRTRNGTASVPLGARGSVGTVSRMDSSAMLRERSVSLIQSQTRKKFVNRSKVLQDEDELVANPNMKPKWLPTMLRTQTRDKILL